MDTSAPLRISIGCSKLDGVIGGGLKTGVVVEITGECGIGKSQLCTQVVLSAKDTFEKNGVSVKAVYLTTSGGKFSIRRMFDIGKRFWEEGGLESPMHDILIRDISNHDEFSNVLTEVDTNLKGDNSSKRTRILAIDAISSVYSFQSSSKSELVEHTNMVSSMGFALKRMAEKHQLFVVVCNITVNSFDPNNPMNFISKGRLVKPAVGKAWDKNVDTRINLVWELNRAATEWTRVIYQSKGDDANGGKAVFDIYKLGIDGR